MIGYNYKSPLVILEERLDSANYIDILYAYVRSILHQSPAYKFIRDNAAPHVSGWSKSAVGWFQINWVNDYTSKSPDNIAIEHV